MERLIPQSLRLTSTIIPKLQKPMGLFFKSGSNNVSPEEQVIEYLKSKTPYIFIVGDYVSHSLIDIGLIPDLIIIDDKTQRNKPFEVKLPEKFEIFEVTNNPGEIGKSAWELIRILCSTVFGSDEDEDLQERILKVIKVNGEEDLLVLPLILDAPLNSIIMYGQPPMITGESGIVLIEVTEKLKLKIAELLEEFESI